jgi:hypothetical protein
LDTGALLQTHAEVAIALAGFASVVAALSRPLSPFARQRFLSLLALSVIQVIGCLLPLWILELIGDTSTGWRALSAVLLGLNVARLWWLVILPTRDLGADERIIINPLMNTFSWSIGYLGLVLFLLNSIGLPYQPNFHVFYGALLGHLLIGFVLFADVATERS